MSQLYISSPVRSPRPRPTDSGSSPAAGIAWQPAALRYRGGVLPPTNPKRLQFPHNPGSSSAPSGAREIVTPAASYDTSREELSAELQAARREDEEHGSTQLILLLTLSVVLLTLPWVVDHPVTLLVPVALFILPITSGALRSLASEGFSLIAAGIRWFWRHRKTGGAYATVQSSTVPAQQRVMPQAQPAVPHTFIQNGQQPQRAWHPPGPSSTSQQHPEHWRSSVSQMLYTGAQGARGAGAAPDWRRSAAQRPRPVVQQQQMVCPQQSGSAGPELATPDLDFDSDNEATPHNEVKQVHSKAPYAQVPHAPGHTHGPPAPQPSTSSQYVKAPRVSAGAHSTDQAECTVYNWDEADTCTQRRGHRSLSDLLNNVQ